MNRSLDIPRLENSPFVARVEHHRVLGSTNDRAKQCAADALPSLPSLPLLIVADAQTAGRGRGANRWWTGLGSVAMSLLIDPRPLGLDRESSPLGALAASVAVVDAMAPRLPGHPVGLHWPNDVMVAGRKLAGVLLEVPSSGLWVVGIGLNTNNSLDDAPPELRETATTLLELTGSTHDRTAVLLSLLEKLEATFRQLADAPSHLARRANDLCLQHGQTLQIESGRVRSTGRCAGIAPDGALLLDTPNGRRAFYSGVLH